MFHFIKKSDPVRHDEPLRRLRRPSTVTPLGVTRLTARLSPFKAAFWMGLGWRSRASMPCHPPPTGSCNSQVRGKSGDRRGSPLTGSYVQPRTPATALSRGCVRSKASHPPSGVRPRGGRGGGPPIGGPPPNARLWASSL